MIVIVMIVMRTMMMAMMKMMTMTMMLMMMMMMMMKMMKMMQERNGEASHQKGMRYFYILVYFTTEIPRNITNILTECFICCNLSQAAFRAFQVLHRQRALIDKKRN